MSSSDPAFSSPDTDRSFADAGLSSTRDSIYNKQFWIAYAANFALVTANSLVYRFAELVKFLGGREETTGVIVGVGLFAVLLLRLVLGQTIDRYGTRVIWALSSLLFIAGVTSFVLCRDVSAGLFVARALYQVGASAMFTCSIVHVQNLVPVYRRTEAIGILGTSGFVGMIAGANLGDLILGSFAQGHFRFVVLFGTAAGLVVIYLAMIIVLTRRELHVPPRSSPPVMKLLAHCWPGPVIFIAIALGMALSVSTVFLTRFATVLNLSGIRTFFTVYCIVGVIFRVPSTQWTKTIGRHKTILIGMAGSIIGHATLPFVTKEWHFVFPAAACGFGHAVLYPAMVSLGSRAFPRPYRGVGTTLVLGFVDAGLAISPPILGGIIDRFGYHAMFYSAAVFGLVVTVYYALTAARHPDNDNDPEVETAPFEEAHFSRPNNGQPISSAIPEDRLTRPANSPAPVKTSRSLPAEKGS
jgi:MFS family permease